MGVFIFTYAAQFDLHAMGFHFLQPIDQIDQFPKTAGMKLRAARRYLHEHVALHKICPSRWNLAQMPIVIVKVHEALSEDASVFNQINLLAAQRMERMDNPYTAGFLDWDGCNRRGIERRDRRTAAR